MKLSLNGQTVLNCIRSDKRNLQGLEYPLICTCRMNRSGFIVSNQMEEHISL